MSHFMKMGGLEVHLISDGLFSLDGGAMFGVIPKPLWEKAAPPDARNRIRLAMNCLLVRTASQWVLIEAGAGDKLDAKRQDIFALGGPPRLLDHMAALGVRPGDVSLVVNTHLHFDHCGWNTRLAGGHLSPTFPYARYAVQRGELEWSAHPTERDRGSYMAENIAPISDAGKWWLLDGDGEVAPGIRVIRVPGHNRDMQCVLLEGGGRTIFLPVDLCPTRHHVATHWVMSYDLYPVQTMENKKKWLAEAARNNWLCVLCHEADTPTGYMREHQGKLAFEPAPFA
ncbi:MAG TPA: MBL fold metallo-hydrolase [Candidatus Acidoferrales bacterium]|nr:MBL fold metallo-hydrolase [Candidatus Acidoferrales bacterium]